MVLPRSAYPVKGILYFLSNFSLIRKIICVLLITLVVALVIIGLTFGFLLRLQAEGLSDAGCPEWLAWLVSVIFCLIESALFTIVFYLLATPIWQDELFDMVLRLRGLGHWLERQRKAPCIVLCCRGLGSGLWLALFQVLLLILTLPINAVPVIGTIVYCYVNSWPMTWGHQIHYHVEIREWTVSQSRRFAWQSRSDYISFGTIAVALELIPLANFLFFWTNVVGAALWTADVLEEEERAQQRLESGNGESSSSHSLNRKWYGTTE